VTIRYRDSMDQERVAISSLRNIIEDKVNIRHLLRKL
jgi:glycyl-tRNA synthetase